LLRYLPTTAPRNYLADVPGRQCPGQVPIAGDSSKVQTWVASDYDFVIEPDHFGTALLPGQTVTFTTC